MKKRQLFTAIDSEGEKVLIDRVDKTAKGKFLCPYCRKEVIARLGEQKVWHFAHLGSVCEFLNVKGSDGSEDSRLDFSATPMKDLDQIDIGMESRDFLCVQCKRRFNKVSGLKWQGNEYICRQCFERM